MSRSRKKKPFIGNTTSRSEKLDKRFANRKYRRKVREAIRNEEEIIPDIREVSDVWTFDKDGKNYIGNDDDNEKYLRK